MRILTRYLLRVHAGPFLFALVALTGLLFVNVVARRFPELAGKGLPIPVILEVFALSLPHIVALTLPMAVLVAVLYAFGQLAADNEITALKASGVNLVRLIVPLLGAGAVLAAFMVYFNDRILPETNHDLKLLLMDINRKSPTLQLKEQVVNEIQTNDLQTRYFLQATNIDRMSNKLRGVVIYDLSIAGRDRTVYADSGRMAFNREQTDLFLTLYDGSIEEVKEAEPHRFQRVYFDEQQLLLSGIGNVLERTTQDAYRSDREMSLAMLSAGVDTARKELELASNEARKFGLVAVEPVLGTAQSDSAQLVLRNAAAEVRMLAARAASARQRINELQVEWHKKFAIPFACIVFVMLGAPLAIRFPRGGPGMVIAISLTIFGIYYMSLIGGESLGDKGRVEPFWGPWAPNLVFLPLSLWALVRIGRETATTRGGGWADLAGSIKSALVPWKRKGNR
ncbi:MAG: LptF/LptG family permease [Gemmatimonadota bacterium]